ncbi:MAG: iron-sulfur cluster-binding protein [Rhodospirillales bacterium]|jgi:L-lactate dehydrogenase complex protein LldF|nr:iron-sulfur cluster-binding protein [Rhodospirillales bacterium]
MQSKTAHFKENAKKALGDAQLQRVLDKFSTGFPVKRAQAAARLPEFEDLRDAARDIRAHVLDNLDVYLERFETKVIETGGMVHWARGGSDACSIIGDICKSVDAKTVTKSKSMIGEEIAINDYLEKNGVDPVETDLGEYIIQLRDEPPSHIIVPAVHLSKEQVAETFREKHTDLPADRVLDNPRILLDEARGKLREKFLSADVGLSGANMLVAETGSIALVTNEGNADLSVGLPRVHIVLASIEKVVPCMEDAWTLLRVLARSATGQDLSVYTSFVTGPKRSDDLDGPEEFHVVLLDNGRSSMLGSEFHDMLRCIKCGSCINHCPVYAKIGGHAYGWVYPGPMGSVLSPALLGDVSANDLPNASTLCGKCETVCPVRIPLPEMLRQWRNRQFEANQMPTRQRLGLRAWAWLARRPRTYRLVMEIGTGLLTKLAPRNGRFKNLPFAKGWTSKRDLPAPQGKTFMAQWKQRSNGGSS